MHSTNIVKVKTTYGEFNIAGFTAMDIHYPVEMKPNNGFVYVEQPDGILGSIPKQDVLNWDDLPDIVELSAQVKEVKEKIINVNSNQLPKHKLK